MLFRSNSGVISSMFAFVPPESAPSHLLARLIWLFSFGSRRRLFALLCVALQIGAHSLLSAAVAAPKVTFNTVYQINDNGVYSGFAANSTGPDIGVISSSTPTPNVVVSGVGVFTASAASTSATGTFQLQGNDVTGTLTFTGAVIGSDGVRIPAAGTAAFSLSGGISKHIKTRDGLGPSTSEMFY